MSFPDSASVYFSKSDEEANSSRESSLADLQAHLELLNCGSEVDETSNFGAVPIFTNDVRKHGTFITQLYQYGLLGENLSDTISVSSFDAGESRVFNNIAAPTSTYICGSQGSGKSHTLSVLLENYLIPCKANRLPRPLTGLIFHYDTFISDAGGSACEAAYLASHQAVKVRVLCAPTNIGQIKVLLPYVLW